MGRQKSPERIRLEEILSNGEWHDREDLFYKWSEKINPAKATRAAAKSYAANHGTEQRSKETSAQQLEMYGARHIYNQLLGTLRSSNRIEERKTSSGSELRFLSEKATADLDSYSSIVVLDESETETVISIHDPKQSALIISLRRLEDWSDERLNLLISWCQVRQDESSAYNYAKLMAMKVLRARAVEFNASRA